MYKKLIQSKFPCVLFSEGRKSVNTLENMTDNGTRGLFLADLRIKIDGYISTEQLSTQGNIASLPYNLYGII